MGAGRECLGSLVLTRALGEPEWTDADVDAALEVGRDLGRAVLNARALERERELVRELKALDDYKTKLIATLSHELKSPLAAMLANIEFLQTTVDLDRERPRGPRRRRPWRRSAWSAWSRTCCCWPRSATRTCRC